MSGDRKVGENFDGDSKFKNFSYLMNVAQYLENKGKFSEAIDLYNQVLFTLPDSIKAYEAIINIYQKQGNVEAEKEVLRKAISNCKKNDEFKKRLNEIN